MAMLSKELKRSVVELIKASMDQITQGVPVGDQVRGLSSELGSDECWDWGVERYAKARVGGKMVPIGAAIVGTLGTALVARHSCDNPPCINPNHLAPGSHLDNAQDKVERGRSTAGDRHPSAKLSYRDVSEIRDRYEICGYNRNNGGELASEFGVTRDHISAIMRGKYRASA
jgi:hypothetical protein